MSRLLVNRLTIILRSYLTGILDNLLALIVGFRETCYHFVEDHYKLYKGHS